MTRSPGRPNPPKRGRASAEIPTDVVAVVVVAVVGGVNGGRGGNRGGSNLVGSKERKWDLIPVSAKVGRKRMGRQTKGQALPGTGTGSETE